MIHKLTIEFDDTQFEALSSLSSILEEPASKIGKDSIIHTLESMANSIKNEKTVFSILKVKMPIQLNGLLAVIK